MISSASDASLDLDHASAVSATIDLERDSNKDASGNH